MLPRHMQRLGRDWVAHWDSPQRFCWNSRISNSIRWVGRYSWAPYLSTGDFTVNWRPPRFFGPWRPPQYWNWQPDNFTHNSSFHFSNPNMKSEGDEPSSKRRRHSGQNDVCSPNEEISSSNQNEAACLSTPPKNEEENTANTRGMIKRHWEYFCHHSKKMKILEDEQIDQNNTEDKGKFDFTVMSYNILSQNLLEDNSHLYNHCRRPVLIWGYRFPNILREIKHLDADVSGQEQFPRGQRILTIPIWPPSLGISQSCVYEVQQQRQEENTGGEKKESKLEHTEEIIIAAEKFPSKLQHHFRLSSVYSHYLPESGIPEVTTCHSRSAVTVDYIFYSAAKDDSAAQPGAEDTFDGGLKLLGRLSLLTEQDLWTVNGLPNEHNSSDHLSLLAQFRLIEQ
nr:protein angel homolog 2 isoform X4 [Caretta caretta]